MDCFQGWQKPQRDGNVRVPIHSLLNILLTLALFFSQISFKLTSEVVICTVSGLQCLDFSRFKAHKLSHIMDRDYRLCNQPVTPTRSSSYSEFFNFSYIPKKKSNTMRPILHSINRVYFYPFTYTRPTRRSVLWVQKL